MPVSMICFLGQIRTSLKFNVRILQQSKVCPHIKLRINIDDVDLALEFLGQVRHDQLVIVPSQHVVEVVRVGVERIK